MYFVLPQKQQLLFECCWFLQSLFSACHYLLSPLLIHFSSQPSVSFSSQPISGITQKGLQPIYRQIVQASKFFSTLSCKTYLAIHCAWLQKRPSIPFLPMQLLPYLCCLLESRIAPCVQREGIELCMLHSRGAFCLRMLRRKCFDVSNRWCAPALLRRKSQNGGGFNKFFAEFPFVTCVKEKINQMVSWSLVGSPNQVRSEGQGLNKRSRLDNLFLSTELIM